MPLANRRKCHSYDKCLTSMRWLFCIAVISAIGIFSEQASAQQNFRNYGESCNNTNFCMHSLVCAAAQGELSGFCRHQCSFTNPICPHDEPCLADNGGQCFCRQDSDCRRKGTRCIAGECVEGTRQEGESCNDERRCDVGMICIRPSWSKTESYCFKLCAGTTCSNRLPCQVAGVFRACFCDPTQGDAQCKAAGLSGTCVAGLCKPPPEIGESCDPAIQACMQGLLCAETNTQTKAKHCLPRCSGTGVGNCLGGELCQGVNLKYCRCEQNRACPDGGQCVNGLCGGIACNARQPCPNGERCIDGMCDRLDICGGPNNRACPSTEHQVCFQPLGTNTYGLCIRTCQNRSECPNNTRCHSLSGSTKRGCYCTADSNCEAGQRCFLYSCRKACSTHEDCPMPELCKQDVCQKPSAEDPKREPSPVDAGIPEESITESEITELTDISAPDPNGDCNPVCGSGFVCVNGACVRRIKEPGESCENNEDCASNFCFGQDLQKICSPTNQQLCGQYNLEPCQVGGKIGCCPKAVPPPDLDNAPSCGCESSPDFSLLALLLSIIVLCGVLWRPRHI